MELLPITGNAVNIWLIIAIAVLAIGGGVTALVISRRRAAAAEAADATSDEPSDSADGQ